MQSQSEKVLLDYWSKPTSSSTTSSECSANIPETELSPEFDLAKSFQKDQKRKFNDLSDLDDMFKISRSSPSISTMSRSRSPLMTNGTSKRTKNKKSLPTKAEMDYLQLIPVQNGRLRYQFNT